MNLKSSYFYRVLGLLLILLLILPILAACDGDETTPVTTAMPMDTATVTTSELTSIPSSVRPVKIGVITSWSGRQAMLGTYLADPIIKVVEWQVKHMGGILGGREVKIVKYNDESAVSGGVTGARKLLYDDGVSILTWGGSLAESATIASFAEETQILYIMPAPLPEAPPGKPWKYALSCGVRQEDRIILNANLITKVLKPKTIGILAGTIADSRLRCSLIKEAISQADIKIVCEEYVDETTSDVTTFLTKIKRSNPDLLLTDFIAQDNYINIAKQIVALGGWGDIKVLAMEPAAESVSLPGAAGWYVLIIWLPGSTYPASIKFEQEYQQVNGKAPANNHVYPYLMLWTTIYAIKLAGTDSDRVAIAETAQSGKLEWDTPLGLAHWTLDHPGYPGVMPVMTRIEGGKLVSITMPE